MSTPDTTTKPTEKTFFSNPIDYITESRVGRFTIETGSAIASRVQAVALKVFQGISTAAQEVFKAVAHPLTTGSRVITWIRSFFGGKSQETPKDEEKSAAVKSAEKLTEKLADIVEDKEAKAERTALEQHAAHFAKVLQEGLGQVLNAAPKAKPADATEKSAPAQPAKSAAVAKGHARTLANHPVAAIRKLYANGRRS